MLIVPAEAVIGNKQPTISLAPPNQALEVAKHDQIAIANAEMAALLFRGHFKFRELSGRWLTHQNNSLKPPE